MINGNFEAKTTNDFIFGSVNWSSILNSVNNTSDVTATLILKKYYLYPICTKITQGTGTWTIYINDVSYTITAFKNFNFDTDTTVISKTITVPHDPSGSKQCFIKVTGGIPNSSYTDTRAEKLITLETNIIQATILTAPNFTDAENPTITFSNPKGYPVQFKIEDIGLHSDLIATDKIVDYVGDSYTFELTEEQRNILTEASQNYAEFPIRFTVSTYIPAGSETPTYFSWLDRIMYVTDGLPIFTDFDHEDVEPDTLALTGDSSIYIQKFSKCKITVPVAKKMIAQKDSIGNGYTAWIGDIHNWQPYSDTSNVVFDNIVVNSNVATVVAFDSRNKHTNVNKALAMIQYDYSKSNVIFSVTRENGFGAKTEVKSDGSYNPIVIGGVEKNVVRVTFRYTPNVEPYSWTTNEYTVILTNGTFSEKREFVLDANTEYIYEIWADDKFDTLDSSDKDQFHLLYTSTPIAFFDKDFKVGINKIPDGVDQGLYLKIDDNFIKQIFPVGSVYTVTRSSGIDPNTFLIGYPHWDKIQSIYNDDETDYIDFYERVIPEL